MKRILLILFFSLSVYLLLLALPTFAQDATPEATETSLTQNARDYCAGQVSYTLPEGWAEGSITRTSTSVGRTIASSKATLNKYASLLDPDESSVIIGVFDRTSFADSLNVAPDADISTLLRALLTAPTSLKFTLSEISPLTLGDYAAAQVSGYIDSEYEDVVLVNFDSDTLGMVLLAANPNERTRWNDIALALAESLSPNDVPRFPETDGSAPLTQSFPTSDCSVVFGFPNGWTATKLSAEGAPLFNLWLTNYDSPGTESGNLLDPGQARIELHIISANRVTGDLVTFANNLSVQVTDSEKVAQSDVTIGDHPAQMVEMQIKDGDKHIGDALMLVLDDADGSRAALTLYTGPGELNQWRATALAITASLRVHLPASN